MSTITVPAEVFRDQEFYDSRDIIARFEWVREQIEDQKHATLGDANLDSLFAPTAEADDELQEEFDMLSEFVAEFGDHNEFEDGITVISDDYFEEYAEEYVKDCGMIPDDLPAFIENNIDWQGVADDLKADYTAYTWNGDTYWVRD